MLQRISRLSPALLATRGAVAPTLLPSSQARFYGFGSHMSDNDPELMEMEKQKQLKGKTVSHVKEAPGWNEMLASDSEAVVKAEMLCPDCPPEELQKQTIQILEEEAKAEAECRSSA